MGLYVSQNHAKKIDPRGFLLNDWGNMNFIPSRIFVTIFTVRRRDWWIDLHSCVSDVHNIWIFNVRFTSEAKQNLKKKCTKNLK